MIGRAAPAVLLASLATTGSAAAPPSTDALEAFIRDRLGIAGPQQRAAADLDGDGRPETLVYASAARRCGSGGCTLYVITPAADGFRVVLRSTVTRLPVSLLPTTSNGWRDIGVTVGGGGIRAWYMARLGFDGQRYPGNPTVPPAEPLPVPAGAVLLARDDSRSDS